MWRPGLAWLHVVSDALIALAYFSIPFTLIYFIRKRRDVPFNWIFVCFGMFILACGATHNGGPQLQIGVPRTRYYGKRTVFFPVISEKDYLTGESIPECCSQIFWKI
jgi:hypothetical protein